ncbi:MAG TPA: hypothetical protein VHD14_14315 [Pseudolabrys sp.]|nr:hypothetical protein [Pseudolabrys sp.]
MSNPADEKSKDANGRSDVMNNTSARLMRQEAQYRAGGEAFVAAIWIVFYVVAIVVAVKWPLILGATQIAGHF